MTNALSASYQLFDSFSALDIAAICWFFVAWFLFSFIAKRLARTQKTNLNNFTYAYRDSWMLNMLERDNRMVDASLLNTLLRSVSFFLSGTLLLIAGMYAALGSAQDVLDITQHIPFAQTSTIHSVKIKFLLLMSIFVYVFFKLVWVLRLYNIGIVMIGAAPISFNSNKEKRRYAKKMGVVLSRGGMCFNEGMRGFEFGLAYLGWLIHPWALIIATTVVLLVAYRREYSSATLRAMQKWDQKNTD